MLQKFLFNVQVRIMRLLPSFCQSRLLRIQECNKWPRIYWWDWKWCFIRWQWGITIGAESMDGCHVIKWEWGADQFINFIEYMALMKQQYKGFVYEYGRDPSRKNVGVIWMTAMMMRRKAIWFLRKSWLHEACTEFSTMALGFCSNLQWNEINLCWLWGYFMWKEEASVWVSVWVSVWFS